MRKLWKRFAWMRKKWLKKSNLVPRVSLPLQNLRQLQFILKLHLYVFFGVWACEIPLDPCKICPRKNNPEKVNSSTTRKDDLQHFPLTPILGKDKFHTHLPLPLIFYLSRLRFWDTRDQTNTPSLSLAPGVEGREILGTRLSKKIFRPFLHTNFPCLYY